MKSLFFNITGIFIILGAAASSHAHGPEEDSRCRERVVEAVIKDGGSNIRYESVKVIEPFLDYVVYKNDPYVSFTWEVTAGGEINGSEGDCSIKSVSGPYVE